MRKIIVAFIVILLSVAAQASENAQPLFHTINERLQYMDDVAVYKAEHHLPIEDVAREQVVVEKAKAAAGKQGLNPESVEAFFKAQIAVAKAIQYRRRAELLSQPSHQQARDLKTVVRPALLQLGDQIIAQIAKYLQHGAFDAQQYQLFASQVNVKYVTDSDKRLLFNALLKIQRK